MEVDVLVIGQGISGTCFSYCLSRKNISFLIIDNSNPNSPSRSAAGIINPVTGRRIVRTWMIEEFIPFALDFYTGLGNELGINVISEKKIIDFFPSPQMKLAFEERINEGENFLNRPVNPDHFLQQFQYDFGYGIITPSYTVHLAGLLTAWRNKLGQNNLLINESFDLSRLDINDSIISYKDIKARRIVFCDGVESFKNLFFNKLPFAPNKGEMLIVEIPGLSSDYLYKKGMTLAPLPDAGLFWLGSNYLWNFDHENPTPGFYKQSEILLKSWLKMPFKILEHKASVRPATLERRPFAGFHPLHPNVGILNGMGTKGCSLAPYFAKQLVENIAQAGSITPEADISRFRKILSV
jgi:glycine/D-amino acid oxidase-like deaminating enzyme